MSGKWADLKNKHMEATRVARVEAEVDAEINLSHALCLLNEAEALINSLCGDWGHVTGKNVSLVDRIRDFLVQHGARPLGG